jgi:hypothetical protein
VWQRADGQAPCDLNPEAVIAEKDISDSGHKNPGHIAASGLDLGTLRDGFNLVGVEEEAVSRLPHQADVPAGIIVDDNTKVNFSFIVLLDGLDDGSLIRQRNIHDVAPSPGMEAYPAAWSHGDVRDAQLVYRILGF